MATKEEHLIKYRTNKNILENVLDVKQGEHSDWITTVSFYAALHVIESVFAKQRIDNRTHLEREKKILETDLISRKVADKYQQLKTYSRIARYGPSCITPTISAYSKVLLKDIEESLLDKDEIQK